jgi:hypothetical protein
MKLLLKPLIMAMEAENKGLYLSHIVVKTIDIMLHSNYLTVLDVVVRPEPFALTFDYSHKIPECPLVFKYSYGRTP